MCSDARKCKTVCLPTGCLRRLERNLGILAVVRMKVDTAETDGRAVAEVAGPSIFKCQPL